MHAYLAELEAEERRNQRISAILTALIMVIFFIISLIWTAWRQEVPPPGEEYEVLGAIDFGNYQSGSRQVNNFEKPVEDPAETPPPPKPTPQEEVAEPEPAPAPEPVETQPDPSPVTVPESPPEVKPEPKPTEPEPPKPKPKPKEETKPEKPAESSNTTPAETPATKPSDKEPGSNHGNNDSGTGNQGQDKVKVLDPQGLYSFGTGTGGGLQGRSPLDLAYPEYNVQEEGDIQFEFIIAPDGRVVHVKPVGVVRQLGLKNAGIAAIKKWRFSPLPPGQTQNQRVRVTIKFRLK